MLHVSDEGWEGEQCWQGDLLQPPPLPANGEKKLFPERNTVLEMPVSRSWCLAAEHVAGKGSNGAGG